MTRCIPPLALGIVLHYFTTNEKYPLVNTNETRRKWADYLVENGILRNKSKESMVPGLSRIAHGEYEITEKGKFYVEYLLSIPFPVERFEIPEVSNG